jgi:hypothetical protein
VHSGNLGGLDGADAICAARAGEAGLSGTFKAWLSDSTTSAAARLYQNPGPYSLVDGTRIAASWGDLTDGAIMSPLDVTENGAAIGADREVWSNSDPDGSIRSTDPSLSCEDWMNGGGGRSGPVGETDETDDEWTNSHSDPCNSTWRLYCFQQTA